MGRENIVCLLLAKRLGKCPFVDKTITSGLEDRWSDPWLENEPTTQVDTTDFLATVRKPSRSVQECAECMLALIVTVMK